MVSFLNRHRWRKTCSLKPSDWELAQDSLQSIFYSNFSLDSFSTLTCDTRQSKRGKERERVPSMLSSACLTSDCSPSKRSNRVGDLKVNLDRSPKETRLQVTTSASRADNSSQMLDINPRSRLLTRRNIAGLDQLDFVAPLSLTNLEFPVNHSTCKREDNSPLLISDIQLPRIFSSPKEAKNTFRSEQSLVQACCYEYAQ